MREYLLRINPLAPQHIGEPGIGLENCAGHIPSDTLFGALCTCWALLYGRSSLEGLLSRFSSVSEQKEEPPFYISSAFPRIINGAGTEYFFLPKPFSPPPPPEMPGNSDDEQMDEQTAELLKNAPLVDKNTFENWIAGKQLAGSLSSQEWEKQLSLIESASSSALMARTRLDRLTNQSQIYFVKTVKFARGHGGLFFLARIDEKISGQFLAVLKLLGEQGIGGERSLGLGRFEAKIEPLPGRFFKEPDRPDAFIALSLYHPQESELSLIQSKHAHSYYDVIQRGGWVDSPYIHKPLRKRRCRMFREGSVFKHRPIGRIIDVGFAGLPHSIYRYGLAYSVGIKLTERKGEV